MAILDGVIGPIAKTMIDTFGVEVIVIKKQADAYDPGKSRVLSRPTEFVTKGLIEDYNLQDSGAGFSSGLIQANDRKITIAGSGLEFEPKPGDTVKALNVIYNITRVLRTMSGAEVALYELNARL